MDFGSPFSNVAVYDFDASLSSNDFFYVDFSADMPFPQDFLGPSRPVLSPTVEDPPHFFWEVEPATTSVQTVEEGGFPSLPAPGVSNIRPEDTVMPTNYVARGYSPCYETVLGPGVTSTSGVYPTFVAPAATLSIPPLPVSPTFPIHWMKIPQRDYTHGSKQLDFNRLNPIFFSTKGYPGVNLGDLLRKNFSLLDGRDDPMLQNASGTVSCRLLFPGYPDNGSSCQIHTLNWTKTREPIPRSKLAHEIAKKVDRYLTRMAGITPDGTVEDHWEIGRGFMHIDNMFLVSFDSVSKGSFQPEIWVAVPPMPHVA